MASSSLIHCYRTRHPCVWRGSKKQNWSWMNREDQNWKGRIGGSRWSMQGYILVLKREPFTALCCLKKRPYFLRPPCATADEKRRRMQAKIQTHTKVDRPPDLQAQLDRTDADRNVIVQSVRSRQCLRRRNYTMTAFQRHLHDNHIYSTASPIRLPLTHIIAVAAT